METHSDEIQTLRRCVRDLVALSTLPEVWIDYGPLGIAESLADVLLSTLYLDFVFVRCPTDGSTLEVARFNHPSETTDQAPLIRKALGPWLEREGSNPPPSLPNPLGSGTMRLASAPIGREGEYAVVVAGSQRADFPTQTERLLLGVGANQAAIVLARTRAEEALKEADRRKAEQARETAILEERNRMAGEIHDGLGQAFTGSSSSLQAAERLLAEDREKGKRLLQNALDLAHEGMAEARRSAHALRPQVLEEGDLAGALERMTRQLSADQATRIAFRLNGTPRPLPPEVAEQLLRIGQEALTNALHHGQASAISVDLTFAHVELRLCVEDDGRGFAVDSPLSTAGFGLTGMQERASIIGAELDVTSEPGRGTRVHLTWPFPPG
jgi:signal transduction histidine kinase